MRSIKNLPLIVLLILAMMASIIVLPACSDDDDDDDDGGITTTGNEPGDTTPTIGGSEVLYTLKLASANPATSFEGQLSERFAQMLNEYTDGKIEVELYPNSMLYGSAEMLQATQSGANDITFDLTYYFYTRFPYLMLSHLNGFWQNEEHCLAFDSHPDVIAKASATCDELGLHFLGLPLVSTILVHFSKDKELTSLKSMDGMTVGTVAGAATTNASQWSGCRAIQVDVTEMYSGFQMGMFEVLPNTLTAGVGYQIWDMGAKHMLVQPRGANMTMMMTMNKDTWENFPADIQDIITNQVMPDFMALLDEERATIYEEYMAIYREQMETVNILPDEEVDRMLAETADNAMTKMMISQAGELYDLAESLRP